MSGSMSLNAIHTAVAHCLNTAPGGDERRPLPGRHAGRQHTGAAMFDVSSSNSSLEDELQVGVLFHVYAGQSDSGFIGSVYQVFIANPSGGWTMPAAASALYTNPYQMLKM
jgi:hypothetical protein